MPLQPFCEMILLRSSPAARIPAAAEACDARNIAFKMVPDLRAPGRGPDGPAARPAHRIQHTSMTRLNFAAVSHLLIFSSAWRCSAPRSCLGWAVALLIKLGSRPGRCSTKQKRYGYKGRIFKAYNSDHGAGRRKQHQKRHRSKRFGRRFLGEEGPRVTRRKVPAAVSMTTNFPVHQRPARRDERRRSSAFGGDDG